MRRLHSQLLIAALACAMGVTLSSCEYPYSTGPRLKGMRPLTSIFDAAHSGGNPHVFFLPPAVPQPSFSGTFDPTLAPEVEICVYELSAGCTTLIADYTTTTGPGAETVRLDASDQLYIVNWKTSQFSLADDQIYRISIHVAGNSVGYADVEVMNNAQSLKNVDTQQYIALTDDRTLPIKFRLEQEMVVSLSVTPNPGSVGVGASLPLVALLLDAHGNVVSDQTVTWSTSDAAIAQVSTVSPQSANVAGEAGGQVTIIAASGSASGTSVVNVQSPVGFLTKRAIIPAGQSVLEYLSAAIAPPADVPVAIHDLNPFVSIAEPGVANYTYGGETGTYVLKAGMTLKDLTIFGVNGIGTDTLIASAPGYGTDTAIITVVRAAMMLNGLPQALRVGDSAAVQLTVLDLNGNPGNLAYASTFALAADNGLSFSDGQSSINSILVPQRTSATFYVKAVAAGTSTISITNGNFVPYTASLSVAPATSFTILASPNPATVVVQRGEFLSIQIQVQSTSGGTLSLTAGPAFDSATGTTIPWVTVRQPALTQNGLIIPIAFLPDGSVSPGTYQLYFDVTAAGATNSPLRVLLNVTVT